MMEHSFIGRLPPIRRLARALLGNPEAADALVLATVQSLTRGYADLEELDQIDLYGSLADIWLSELGEQLRRMSRGERISAYDRNLAALPPTARIAFLLSVVEDFDSTSIADILDIPSSEVADILQTARRDVAANITTEILIIEDEFYIATELEEIVLSLGHSVTAIERTYNAAVSAISKAKPGLILADVQLADGSSGLHAVCDILKTHAVPVIFITAYPE